MTLLLGENAALVSDKPEMGNTWSTKLGQRGKVLPLFASFRQLSNSLTYRNPEDGQQPGAPPANAKLPTAGVSVTLLMI
jgi:hypothetical protein